jgi:hypothetical protein
MSHAKAELSEIPDAGRDLTFESGISNPEPLFVAAKAALRLLNIKFRILNPIPSQTLA